MTLIQLKEMISNPLYSLWANWGFNSNPTIKAMVQGMEGGLDWGVVSLFTTDKYLVWVEFSDGQIIGSCDKHIG